MRRRCGQERGEIKRAGNSSKPEELVSAADIGLTHKAVRERLGERRGNGNPQNFGELKGMESTAIAASRAGFGNPETYRQARAVVASNDNELIEAMDSGLSA